MKKNGLISLSLSFSVVMVFSTTHASAKTINSISDESDKSYEILAYAENTIEQIPVSAIEIPSVDLSNSMNQLALLQPTSGLLYPSDVLAAEAEAKRQLQAEAALPLSSAQPMLVQDNVRQQAATTPTLSSDPTWQAYAPPYNDHWDYFRQATYSPTTYYPSPSTYYYPYYSPYYGASYGTSHPLGSSAHYGVGRYSGGYLGAYYPYLPYMYNKGVMQQLGQQSMTRPSLRYGYQGYNMATPPRSDAPQSMIRGALPFPFPPVNYGASTGGTQTIAPQAAQPLTTPPTANVKPAIPTPAIPTAETQAANQHVGKWVRPPQYPSEMFAQGVTQTDGQPQALPAPIQQPTLHPEFQQLKAELAALKNRLNQVNQYLAALKTVNQQLNEEKKRLSQQFAQQQYEAQKTAKQIDDNNSREQARLHEQLASTKAALSTEQQKTRGFDEENAALRKQLAEAQQALAGLSTQQSQAQTNKSDLEAQVAALIQEKQQAAQDKATTDQQVAVLIQEKEQAAQDRTTIERQLAELTQEKEQATQDHDTAEQQLIQTNELLIEQQNSYQKLQTQSEALVQEKAENREQISRLQQALLVANQQAESENQQQYALAQQYDTIKSLLAQSALALAACQTNQERDSEARQRSFAAQHTLEQPLADYDQQNPLLNTSNALLQQENNQDQQRVEALAQAPLTPMPDGDEHDHDVAIDSKDQCSNTPESTAVGMSDCNADHDQDGVSDSQDQCPNTLADVRVNEQGCEPDQDGDGIVNRLDDCPLSAPFAEVNERGCLPDRDGDGVIDVRDQCPDSPKNSGVDAKGCVLDSDQDGIMDADDHCPSSPQDSFVNDQGCPFDDKEANRADGDDDNQKPQEATDNTGNISNNTRKVDLIEGDEGGNQAHQTTSSKSDTALSGGKNDDELAGNQTIAEVTENILETDDLPDADQDGVPDSSDLCSDSKVSEETRIDQLGCEKGMAINLEGVNFEKGSATLTAVSLPILDQALQILKNVPDITLEVGGHTDSKGNEQSNLQLSQRRAESVQHYFLDQGLSANHLVAKGYGETQAIADNNTAEGRAKNRRVELKVLD